MSNLLLFLIQNHKKKSYNKAFFIKIYSTKLYFSSKKSTFFPKKHKKEESNLFITEIGFLICFIKHQLVFHFPFSRAPLKKSATGIAFLPAC